MAAGVPITRSQAKYISFFLGGRSYETCRRFWRYLSVMNVVEIDGDG